MMRLSRRAPLLLAAAWLLAAASEAQARYQGNFNLFAGQKWLSQSDWAPVDQQPQIGLMLDFAEERVPVHFALEIFVSHGDAANGDPAVDAPVSGSSTEFGIGVRKVWGQGAARPHLGAGADVVSASEERSGPYGKTSNEDRGYGAWIDAGVSWRLAGHLNLGFELRYSMSNLSFGTGSAARDVKAGGVHAGLLLGYGW